MAEGSTASRRAILGAGAASTAALLGGCSVYEAKDPTAQSTTSAPVRGQALAALADVPVGGGIILTDTPVVLTQPEAGTVRAFSAVCTHQGCMVSSIRNGKISCPCHGSVFSAADGSVVQGPAAKPLPPVEVKVKNGSITRA